MRATQHLEKSDKIKKSNNITIREKAVKVITEIQ